MPPVGRVFARKPKVVKIGAGCSDLVLRQSFILLMHGQIDAVPIQFHVAGDPYPLIGG